MSHVHAVNTWDRRITCVSHPDAAGVVETAKFGNIRTEVGPAGYAVSIAEKDEVTGFVHHRTERVTL